jgi:hypothetical protein
MASRNLHLQKEYLGDALQHAVRLLLTDHHRTVRECTTPASLTASTKVRIGFIADDGDTRGVLPVASGPVTAHC